MVVGFWYGEVRAADTGCCFGIGRSANIHDPATLARFEEHAIFIAAQWEANRQRDLYFDRICRNKWPAGP